MTFSVSDEGVLRLGAPADDEDPLARVRYLLDEFYEDDDLEDEAAGLAGAERLLMDLTRRALHQDGTLPPAEIERLTS